MFAKRIGMIALIDRGVSARSISELLGVSSSTVSRLQVAMERGVFKETRKRLKHIDPQSRLLKFLYNIGAIPFGPRRKSLARLLDEM